ncbi:hypothetical protein KAR91_61055 [Candidatus Pacearchaeota archaeon]|nr:hypothetical protein [Candidatus Pacearchaeota archaeon]
MLRKIEVVPINSSRSVHVDFYGPNSSAPVSISEIDFSKISMGDIVCLIHPEGYCLVGPIISIDRINHDNFSPDIHVENIKPITKLELAILEATHDK